jgi:hypothetical protein
MISPLIVQKAYQLKIIRSSREIRQRKLKQDVLGFHEDLRPCHPTLLERRLGYGQKSNYCENYKEQSYSKSPSNPD